MKISEVRKEMYDKMCKIPSWIDTKSIIDHQIWEAMSEINDMLLVLLTDRLLRDKSIEKLIEKVDSVIEYMMAFCDVEKQVMVYVYYTTLMQHMILRFQDEEQFEVCRNLKLFFDSYFQNYTHNND